MYVLMYSIYLRVSSKQANDDAQLVVPGDAASRHLLTWSLGRFIIPAVALEQQMPLTLFDSALDWAPKKGRSLWCH